MAGANIITDDQLRELTRNPPSKTTDIPIPQHKGLRVRHYAGSGTVSFFHIYRHEGKQRRHVLGRFRRKFQLLDAFDVMNLARDRLKGGIDPVPRASAISTVTELADEYYRLIDPKGAEKYARGETPEFYSTTAKVTTPGSIYQILENDVKPHLGAFKLSAVRPVDVATLLQEKSNGIGRYADRKPAPGYTGRVMSICRQMFNLAIVRGYMEQHPLATFKPADLGVWAGSKDRCLDVEEIRTFWQATELEHPIYQAAFRILLLTGCRGGELRRAEWHHVDLDGDNPAWTIPKENQKSTHRRKNPRDFVIPLEPMVVAAFSLLRKQTGHQSMCLTSPQGPAFSKSGLRDRLKKLIRDTKMEDFSPHDLRRTYRTGLADCGIPRDIAERAINHSLGGLDETYNRSDYLPQRRAANAKWEAKLGVYLADNDRVVRIA